MLDLVPGHAAHVVVDPFRKQMVYLQQVVRLMSRELHGPRHLGRWHRAA